jgi:hypothetical protein
VVNNMTEKTHLNVIGKAVLLICFSVIIILMLYSGNDIIRKNKTNYPILPSERSTIFVDDDIVSKRYLHQQMVTSPCVEIKNMNQLLDIFENHTHIFNGIEKLECQDISHILDTLFEIDISKSAEIIIPPLMNSLVKRNWLKNDRKLFEQFIRPKTATLTNVWTFETTGINPLRALRPRVTTNADSLKYTLELINKSRAGCNFCDKNYTAMDSFGRVQVPELNIYSAHNSFEYVDPVGIFIPGNIHNWMKVKLYYCLKISKKKLK